VAGGRTAEPSFLREAGAAGRVVQLRNTYRVAVAVDDVSFSVREGEIFGILGPSMPATSGARGRHLLVWAVGCALLLGGVALVGGPGSDSGARAHRGRLDARARRGLPQVVLLHLLPKQRAAGAPRGGDERGRRR
jgi:hypothetical protein